MMTNLQNLSLMFELLECCGASVNTCLGLKCGPVNRADNSWIIIFMSHHCVWCVTAFICTLDNGNAEIRDTRAMQI